MWEMWGVLSCHAHHTTPACCSIQTVKWPTYLPTYLPIQTGSEYTQSLLLYCTDWLSVPELYQGISAGLRAAGLQQLDILAFDACLMSNYEVASQLAPVAR